MATPLTYDFGYTWWIGWGHLVPIALFGGIAVLGLWLGWRRWLVIASTLIVVWGLAGLLITQFLFRINLPAPPPIEQFLSTGSGRVVDVGAGSGRATVGLLLARPRATVTAVDIYKGYYGIDDNTPERLMSNARIAGVADRAERPGHESEAHGHSRRQQRRAARRGADARGALHRRGKGRTQADGIGYVRVASFGRRVTEQLKTQVATLAKGGATRLIVDVRNTAAGDLTEGITAARLFVGSGTLAVRESRTNGQVKIAAEKGDGAVALPVTVLVDSGTSGPAEVFAAALAGNKRAELIGEHTVGRTGVQEIVKLPDGTALWITSTRYLTPGGAQIQAKGIEPDVVVEQPEGDFGAPAPADAILQRAIERLSAKKAA